MSNLHQQSHTFESVWAALDKMRENDERRAAEWEAAAKRRAAEEERRAAEWEAAAKRRAAEEERRAAEADKRMKKLEELYGGISYNTGAVAEEYFFNSFENGKTDFFGEKFDEIEKNVKGIKPGYKDEYDILLINGHTIGIIEIKYKANINDIPQIIRKAETFRVNFPEYAKCKVFLGLASMAFYPELEAECKTAGIAIIKQVGESIFINEEHLKIY